MAGAPRRANRLESCSQEGSIDQGCMILPCGLAAVSGKEHGDKKMRYIKNHQAV